MAITLLPVMPLLAQPLLAQEEDPPALADDTSAASEPAWHCSFEPFIALPVSTTGNLRVNRINVPIDGVAVFGQYLPQRGLSGQLRDVLRR